MPVGLDEYISAARERHQPDDKIKQALVTAGWPDDQVSKALIHADPDLPPPPPPPQAHIGMWTGFLYILFFISLYVLATAIGTLFHDWVDKIVPDVQETLASTNYFRSAYNDILIRGALAAVLVSFPIFVSLALILSKQLMKQPAVSNLRSRKLLIYITLIGTFLIMLGHVISIIYSFLDGKLTINTFGHLVVTFLIAGSIFGYFITEVKHDRQT